MVKVQELNSVVDNTAHMYFLSSGMCDMGEGVGRQAGMKGNMTCSTKHVLSVTKRSSDRKYECTCRIASVCKEIHCYLA